MVSGSARFEDTATIETAGDSEAQKLYLINLIPSALGKFGLLKVCK